MVTFITDFHASPVPVFHLFVLHYYTNLITSLSASFLSVFYLIVLHGTALNLHKKGDISKVLRINYQDRSGNKGLKLKKFRFRREIRTGF